MTVKRFILRAALATIYWLALHVLLAFEIRAQVLFENNTVYYYQYVADSTAIFAQLVDSVVVEENQTTYYNRVFFTSGESQDFQCDEDFFVAQCLYTQSGARAFGARTVVNDQNLWNIENSNGQILRFNFGMGILESDTVYSDEYEYYLMTRLEDIDGYNLGIADEFLVFELNHFDFAGNEIESALDGYHIELGLLTGYRKFIDAYHFPAQEVAIKSVGIQGVSGLNALTEGEVSDYHPGDYFQTYYTNYTWDTFLLPEKMYRTFHILTRSENEDSIYYHVKLYKYYNQWNTDNGYVETWIYDSLEIDMGINRNNFLFTPPHDSEISSHFGYKEWNGMERLGLELYENNYYYCESSGCITYGKPLESSYRYIRYVKGVGKVIDFHDDGFSNFSNSITCYSIGSETYGNCMTVGYHEMDIENAVLLFPNPVFDVLHVKFPIYSGASYYRFIVESELGKQLFEIDTNRHENEIDIPVDNLPSGIYFLRCISDNSTSCGRFVKF